MLGGIYIGRFDINGVISDMWNKEDHLYYEDAIHKRPTRVFTPIDNKNQANQEDFGVFFDEPLPRTLFEVPSFCKNATEIVAKPGVRLNLIPDPVGCFLELNEIIGL